MNIQQFLDDIRLLFRALGTAVTMHQDEIIRLSSLLANFHTSNLEEFFQKRKAAISIADLIINTAVTDFIHARYPNVMVISEENDESLQGDCEFSLFLDPINGSLHYLQGGKEYEINGILYTGTKAIAGLRTIPAMDEEMYSISGGGVFRRRGNIEIKETFAKEFDRVVFLNRRISREIKSRLLNRGFVLKESINDNSPCLQIMTGRASAFVALTPNVWDVAASCMFLKEIGGIVCDWKLNEPIIKGRRFETIMASANSHIAKEIADVL